MKIRSRLLGLIAEKQMYDRFPELEIWTGIKDFPDYAISTFGNVKNLKTNKILKARDNGHGYLHVVLTNESGCYEKKVHRLVAEAFLDKADFKSYDNNDRANMIDADMLQVNHKNEDKHDNRVVNLEWGTPKYNSNFGTRNQKISEARKKYYLGKRLVEDGFAAMEESLIMMSEAVTVNEKEEMLEINLK